MEKAALSLAAAVVSPIFTKLGDKAASYFGGDITEKEMQHLRDVILPKFQTVLRIAEAVPVHELKPWLTTLQDAAYEAEDVLDLYEYKRLEAAQVSSLPNYSLKKLKKKAKDFVAPLSLKTEFKKSMKELLQCAEEADKLIALYGTISQIPLLRVAVPQQQQPNPPTVSSLPSSSVFGRDKERDLLVNMLTSTTADEHIGNQRRTPVLAICGLGGAGKTTLAQSVCNDSTVVKHFSTMMWVHVSRKFDVHTITTQIIESVTKQGEASNKFINLDALQTRLQQVLRSKKFLLVLDDVWSRDRTQWEKLLAPLDEAGDNGSMILVTTREQQLALKLGIENKNIVRLEDLEDKYCMSIFKYYAFGDANKLIDDQELEKQIIEKLKKSPLSAKMMGIALGGETKAVWERTLRKSGMWKDNFEALYLSFDILVPHLQRCFSYCSLFPKGYHFVEVDDLVSLWIAQGFVDAPKDDKMTMEDIGMQYFNELVSSSFFQKETYRYKEGYYYVIHDNLHDLAEEVSKGHSFRIEDDSARIPETVMHLSIFSVKSRLSHIKSDIFKLVNLRTFMIILISKVGYNSMFDGKSEIFKKFKKLRVLHFGDNRLLLHKTIGQLKHIRYLQGKVEEVEGLLKSLGGLYHLQFLNHGQGNIISKIPLFGKLVSLRSIEKYNASRKRGHGIEQLKNLRYLGGSLCINNLENVRNKEEASDASLKEKMFIQKLTLAWTDSKERDGRIDEKVIKGLEPPPNLNALKIKGYNGIEFSEWLINDGGFLRLSELIIIYCPKLIRVPSLPSTLKRLEVMTCANLNEMSSLPLGLRVLEIKDCPILMQLSPFPPNLEELYMTECPGVETLLSIEGGDEQPNQKQQQQHFPLKTLKIINCAVSGKKRLFSNPNKLFTSLTELHLEKLPWLTSLFHPDHKLTSLREIDIRQCENLELFGSPLASISPSLRNLWIRTCPRLTMPDTDGSFLLPSSVAQLIFENCGDPEMNLLGRCLLGLTSLTTLAVSGYSRARSLPDLANPGAIEYLYVWNCRELTSMWNLQPFSSLTLLSIENCPNLTSLPANMENLSSLESLCIERCPKIELLPNLPPSLEDLRIKDCHPQLEADYRRDGPLRHKLHRISRVSIWYNGSSSTSLGVLSSDYIT